MLINIALGLLLADSSDPRTSTTGLELSCHKPCEASGSGANFGDVLAFEKEQVEVSFNGEPHREDKGGVLEPGSSN
ncbi:Methyltransf_11 domain-containing protein [Psidium guajava]|nr:Methyltransf_11 domain-containing protein [Psidium guajava]